jgi:hypothetical protein
MREYWVVVLKNKKALEVIRTPLIKSIDEMQNYIYNINYKNNIYPVKSLSVDLTKIPCCRFKDLFIEIED